VSLTGQGKARPGYGITECSRLNLNCDLDSTSGGLHMQAVIGGKFIVPRRHQRLPQRRHYGLYGGDVSRKKKVLAKQARGTSVPTLAQEPD